MVGKVRADESQAQAATGLNRIVLRQVKALVVGSSPIESQLDSSLLHSGQN
jgi:hypothetical protein